MEGDASERQRRQLELANGLLLHVRQQLARPDTETLTDLRWPSRCRCCIHRGTGAPRTAANRAGAPPWLFTAGKGSPSLP